MATVKDTPKMPDETGDAVAMQELDGTVSIVTEEMVTAAKEDLVRQSKNIGPGSSVRTFKRGERTARIYVSDLFEFPASFDFEGIGPVSYLAQPEGEITGSVDTQTFSIKEQFLAGLVFEEPARRLEQGRALRVVKALKPNGVLAQLPFEPQINNGAAGDVQDALGLRFYQRKGFLIFMDMDTLQPVYCFARNCHAAAMIDKLVKKYPQHADVIGSGYCSWDHLVFTEPNLAAKLMGGGTFSNNATTTRSWQRER